MTYLVAQVKKSGEMNMGNLEALNKLTDTLKNACKIEAMCNGEGGYSRDGEWSARGMYGGHSYDNGGHSYDGGYSGRRDSRGRYASDEGPGYSSNRGYSRDDGKDKLEQELNRLMNNTSSHEEKQALRRAMDVLKRG